MTLLLDSLSRHFSKICAAYTCPLANDRTQRVRSHTRICTPAIHCTPRVESLIILTVLFKPIHMACLSRNNRVCFQLMSSNRRLRPHPPSEGSEPGNSGILNERILILIFESIQWDPRTLCLTASLNQRLRATAKRLLWRAMCMYRAPRMVAALISGAPNGRIGGGWDALAKLMFYCCGCCATEHFQVSQPVAGHLVKESRFSKTSGQSFLTKRCRGDLLYVSDPCEHRMGGMEDDLGVYRGVFRGFMRSRTRACLIRRQVDLEQVVRCPYCGARVWSMTKARLVPKSAARRLGSHDGGLDYFVCVNGHLHGACWLVPLSSDENDLDGDDEDDDGASDNEAQDGVRRIDPNDRTATNGSMSSTGEDIDGPA